MNVSVKNRAELGIICKYAYDKYGWDTLSKHIIYSGSDGIISLDDFRKKVLKATYPLVVRYNPEHILWYDSKKVRRVPEVLSFEEFEDLFL